MALGCKFSVGVVIKPATTVGHSDIAAGSSHSALGLLLSQQF